jgi:hypothetical protein
MDDLAIMYVHSKACTWLKDFGLSAGLVSWSYRYQYAGACHIFLKGCEVELVLDFRYWRKMLIWFSIHVCISYWIGMWSHPAFVWVESHCSAWMSILLSTAFNITPLFSLCPKPS